MFGMFGPDVELREKYMQHVARTGALVLLLVEKGVLTGEDLERMNGPLTQRMTSLLDQRQAQLRDEEQARLERESPHLALLLKALTRPAP